MPFYYFCGFRSVAVNSVYKLQFFYIHICCFITRLELAINYVISTTLSIFQDGGRPPSKIFKYSKYQLLVWFTVGTLKMFEMLYHAKFGQHRLNRGRDMAIFRFSK